MARRLWIRCAGVSMSSTEAIAADRELLKILAATK